jgi:hypothetical protein
MIEGSRSLPLTTSREVRKHTDLRIQIRVRIKNTGSNRILLKNTEVLIQCVQLKVQVILSVLGAIRVAVKLVSVKG